MVSNDNRSRSADRGTYYDKKPNAQSLATGASASTASTWMQPRAKSKAYGNYKWHNSGGWQNKRVDYRTDEKNKQDDQRPDERVVDDGHDSELRNNRVKVGSLTTRPMDSAVNHSSNPAHKSYMAMFTARITKMIGHGVTDAAATQMRKQAQKFYETVNFDARSLSAVMFLEDEQLRKFFARYRARTKTGIHFVEEDSTVKHPDMSKHIVAFCRKLDKN